MVACLRHTVQGLYDFKDYIITKSKSEFSL
jgi:hypothetical protein